MIFQGYYKHGKLLKSYYERNDFTIIDTEQGKYHCWKSAKVIKNISGKKIKYYKVAGLSVDNTWGGTSTGAGNLYEVGLIPTTTAYASNMTIRFLADKDNTAAATITVDGLAVKDIRKGFNQSPLSAGDIRTGQLVEVTYDGTYFILKQLAGGGSSGLIDYILF